jgi:hypothetical protein
MRMGSLAVGRRRCESDIPRMRRTMAGACSAKGRFRASVGLETRTRTVLPPVGEVERVMAQILESVRRDYAFDTEVTAILVAAYDKATFGLHDKGQPGVTREIIAKRIIELAATGERDPDKLSEAALASFEIVR